MIRFFKNYFIILNNFPGVQLRYSQNSSMYLNEIEEVSPLIILFKFLDVIFIF